MRLVKATKNLPTYPKREAINPLLLTVGVAMTLTACTPTGKVPANPTTHPVKESASPKHIEPVSPAGGLPVYIPPISEESNGSRWSTKP